MAQTNWLTRDMRAGTTTVVIPVLPIWRGRFVLLDLDVLPTVFLSPTLTAEIRCAFSNDGGVTFDRDFQAGTFQGGPVTWKSGRRAIGFQVPADATHAHVELVVSGLQEAGILGEVF